MAYSESVCRKLCRGRHGKSWCAGIVLRKMNHLERFSVYSSVTFVNFCREKAAICVDNKDIL